MRKNNPFPMSHIKWFTLRRLLLKVLGYIPRFCDECGKYFKAQQVLCYCSDECQRKHTNKSVNLRNRQEYKKENRNAFLRSKAKENPEWRFKNIAHKTIWRYLSRRGMRSTCAEIWNHLPYSLPQLKAHLESQFNNTNGFTWENYGEAWELDHIVPQSMFSFTSYDCKGFRDCWALSNLRPLEPKKNLKKAHKIETV